MNLQFINKNNFALYFMQRIQFFSFLFARYVNPRQRNAISPIQVNKFRQKYRIFLFFIIYSNYDRDCDV